MKKLILNINRKCYCHQREFYITLPSVERHAAVVPGGHSWDDPKEYYGRSDEKRGYSSGGDDG